MEKLNGRVVAAAAKSREGEESDARWLGKQAFGAVVGLPNDLSELCASGVFAGGHVSEKVSLLVAAHDGETGESSVSFISSRVLAKSERIATSEDDVSRGVINAGDHEIGSARSK